MEEGASPHTPRGNAGASGADEPASPSSAARVIGSEGLAPMLYASSAHEVSSVVLDAVGRRVDHQRFLVLIELRIIGPGQWRVSPRHWRFTSS